MTTTSLVQRACVVCGLGSTRDNWIKSKVVNGTMYVACDGHSDTEFADAIKRLVPPAPAPPATKPVVPNGPSQPNGGTKV